MTRRERRERQRALEGVRERETEACERERRVGVR